MSSWAQVEVEFEPLEESIVFSTIGPHPEPWGRKHEKFHGLEKISSLPHCIEEIKEFKNLNSRSVILNCIISHCIILQRAYLIICNK